MQTDTAIGRPTSAHGGIATPAIDLDAAAFGGAAECPICAANGQVRAGSPAFTGCCDRWCEQELFRRADAAQNGRAA